MPWVVSVIKADLTHGLPRYVPLVFGISLFCIGTIFNIL